LKQIKDTLEELEHSEIMSTLLRLPLMDMDQVKGHLNLEAGSLVDVTLDH
jgi:hypothetical protein